MSVKGRRVMAFMGHTADVVFRCGGTLAKYARHGAKVKVVVATFGARGESPGAWKGKDGAPVDIEGLKRTRKGELERAIKTLGLEVKTMNWEDHPLIVTEERLALLVRELRAFRPETVLLHNPVDHFNPDHAHLCESMLKCLRYAEVDGVQPETERLPYPDVFFVEPAGLVDFSHFVPNAYVDVTETYDLKMKALEEMQQSQPDLYKAFAARAAYRGGQSRSFSGEPRPQHQGVQYAEAFVRFTPYVGPFLP